jgi:hypothetical protein
LSVAAAPSRLRNVSAILLLFVNGPETLAVVGRDTDATWMTLGEVCRERGWSRHRLIQELQNGMRHRRIPEGPEIDWHDPDVRRWLNLETSEVSFYEKDPAEADNEKEEGVWFMRRPLLSGSLSRYLRTTVYIEVLPPDAPTDAEVPATASASAKQGRPFEYPVEVICQVAHDYIEVYGLPRTQTMLREKVRDECERNGFDVPGETRFKQLVDPIHKAQKSQSHKVTN